MGLIVATSLQMEKFFFNGLYVKQVETIRLQLIESYRERVAGGLTAENELLILPAFKAGTVYYKDAAGFYTNSFNTYYHLPVGAKVVFDDGFAVKSFSVTQVKGSLYRLEVIPLSDKAKYTYTFFIAHDGITVYKSAEKTENFDTVEVPAYPGTYTFQCILSTKTNGQRLINAIESLKIDGK